MFCVSFLPLRIFFLVLAASLFNEWGFSQTAVVELTWAVQWINVIVVMAVVQAVCSDSSERHGLTGCIGSTLDVLVQLLGFSVAGSDWGTLLLRGFALCFGLVSPSHLWKKNSPFGCLLFHRILNLYLLYWYMTFYCFWVYNYLAFCFLF